MVTRVRRSSRRGRSGGSKPRVELWYRQIAEAARLRQLDPGLSEEPGEATLRVVLDDELGGAAVWTATATVR